MPSKSHEKWSGERSEALRQIANAHATVGGTSRGRRYATEQINHAYTMLLSSQFQGFSRDLHSECVDYIVDVLPASYQNFLRTLLVRDRKLDKGNPNAGNIGSDFNRLGMTFWKDVKAEESRNDRRKELLEELNSWRNAIAHQDFDPSKLGGTTTLHLSTIKQWHSSVNRLALAFDRVTRAYVITLTGSNPW